MIFIRYLGYLVVIGCSVTAIYYAMLTIQNVNKIDRILNPPTVTRL